jgi:hypothetical protein
MAATGAEPASRQPRVHESFRPWTGSGRNARADRHRTQPDGLAFFSPGRRPGKGPRDDAEPQRGEIPWRDEYRRYSALSGLSIRCLMQTQGVALGWTIAALWAAGPFETIFGNGSWEIGRFVFEKSRGGGAQSGDKFRRLRQHEPRALRGPDVGTASRARSRLLRGRCRLGYSWVQTPAAVRHPGSHATGRRHSA